MRVIWLALFPTHPIAPVDAEGFHLLAVNVLDGRGFAIGWEAPFCPTAVRTPLYPLFVAGNYAILGVVPVRVLPLHLLLEVLTTALVVRLGRDLGGKRVGLWAGVLYACNGTTQRYAGYMLSEVLLMPLLTAALWMSIRSMRHFSTRKAACTGLLWGLALLTKPNVQFLALFVGVCCVCTGAFSKRLDLLRLTFPISHFSSLISRFSFLIFWLILGLTLLPWLARNRTVFGRWMLSTTFEENLARVSAVATLAEIEGVRAEPWTETWEHYYTRLLADAGARYGWCKRTMLRTGCAEAQQQQAQVAEAARELVTAHLPVYARTHLRGVLTSLTDPGHRLWYHILTGRQWEDTGVVANMGARIMWALERGAVGDALGALWTERIAGPPLLAALLWWGLWAARIAVWGLCARGLWRLRRTPQVWLTLAGSIAYMVMLPGPIAHDRFYLPAIPLVTVLIASQNPTGSGRPIRFGLSH